MTANIRTAAQREAEASIHVPVWFPAHDIRADLTPLARQHFVDGAVWAAARVTPTREQIAEVLRGIGLSDLPDEYDSSIHSWRCEHPEIYGRCSCFDDAVNDLVALMAGLAEGETQ